MTSVLDPYPNVITSDGDPVRVPLPYPSVMTVLGDAITLFQ
jgi:hypothetical protein